jgi:hypothetical protein
MLDNLGRPGLGSTAEDLSRVICRVPLQMIRDPEVFGTL